MSRLAPDPNGHGGSQRAMHLLRALSRIGPVDFLLLYREDDRDVADASLAHADTLARSSAKLKLADWASSSKRWPTLSYRQSMIADLFTPYCVEAPRLSGRTLREVAASLPAREYDLVFAGRLPCAVIAEELMHRDWLLASTKVVDFDDIMSRFRRRQLDAEGARQGRFWRAVSTIDYRRVIAAERRVMSGWDAVSVCTEEDAAILAASKPQAAVVRVPNVVDKPRLPVTADPDPRILFVGSLSHGPNVDGLRRFLAAGWPRVREALPAAKLRVVGMLPVAGLADAIEASGAELHLHVPSVEPFYRDCDVVIAPIFFGGGTRIKILEAMSYGRPVVSTTIGAEGLGIEAGRDALIANDMSDFADAVVRLCRDPALRSTLADNAHALQQAEFGPVKLERAVVDMVEQGRQQHRLGHAPSGHGQAA